MTSKVDQDTEGTNDSPYFLFEDTSQCSGRSYLKEGAVLTKMSEIGEALDQEYRKEMRRMAKLGIKQQYVACNIINAEVSAQMNSVEDFKSNSFSLLVSTHLDMVATKVKYSLEKGYKDFFDEFQRHDHDWRLFFSKQNGQHVWAERTCAILGNLATIYRQRGLYAHCEEVMWPYKYVLTQYNAMVLARKLSGAAENDELVCCHLMTYKYHRVFCNLANCLNRPAGTAKTYRFLFQHEIDYGLADTPQGEYAWMMHILNRPCTTEALAATTDEELEGLAEKAHKFKPLNTYQSQEEYRRMNPGSTQWGGSSELAVCANCRSTEPFLSTYKLCARCKDVKYCCRDCQVADFAQHKARCKAVTAGAK